jgi:cyclic-di-AMP phosphodiesterase PgpH
MNNKFNLLTKQLKKITALFSFKKKEIPQPIPPLYSYSAIDPLKKPNLAYHIKKTHSPLIIITSIATLTTVVGYRFYNQPRLAVDTIAPEIIIAPTDGIFEDVQTTEEKRKQARTGVVPVLKIDTKTTEQIELDLTKFINQIDQIRQSTGVIPFLRVEILSLDTQHYLRYCTEEEWKYLQIFINSNNGYINDDNARLIQAISELESYKKNVSGTEFDAVFTQIELARQRYQQGWVQFSQDMSVDLNLEEKRLLISLDQRAWEETQNQIFDISRGIVTQGIPQGLPKTQLEATIDLYLHWRVKGEISSIIRKLLLSNLQPNLIEDVDETKIRAERAVEQVKPVMVTIKQGDAIVKYGDVITQEQFVLLDGFNLSRRSVNWRGVIISGLMVTGAVGLFCVVIKRFRRPLRLRDYVLIGLLSLAPPLTAIGKIPYTPLPLVGFLVSSFYSPAIAITQTTIVTGLVFWTVGGAGWDYIIAEAIAAMVAGGIAARLRSREELALLGLGVGLSQAGLHFILNLIPSAAAETIWIVALMESATYGLSGLVWCIIALGISPYLESLFDLITPIRLAELCNPNRPLLKRLATETPGTFQHTLFVASLAEAAARELHCNVELIRAGTLYHDIGKMHDPLSFIENQMGGPNKHDQIADPWISADIIKKHVTQGQTMAKKYGLPQAIRDFIPEHQGTLLISYFYFQAKEISEKEGKTLVESHFRYDGPIPQSREAGIMMLADSSEAALRSLKGVTPDQALLTLKKIFKARWQDGQLVDSGLKWEELPIIADVFVRIWQQFNHQRIPYPKAALEPHKSS